MYKLKHIILGFAFLVVAVTSLYVMLMWPHPKTKTQVSLLEGATITETTPKGAPFIWVHQKNSKSHVFSEPSRTFSEKDIDSSKLLANLIVWGAGLSLIALVLHGADRLLIK